jgi:hypothetical protein
MNKIERAIYDCKLNIVEIQRQKSMLIARENSYNEMLKNLEGIQNDKSIPNKTIEKQ